MLRRPHRLAAGVLFFLSGASGLVYETAWTRLFQDLFGHSVYTTAAVLAAFMAGLGVGAAVAGGVAHRIRRPVRAYGYLELGIAAVVLSSRAQVGLVDRLLSGFLEGWSAHAATGEALRWLLAFALLLLPTTMMGATLPILCQALTAERERIGTVFGTLYGVNTLGAVLGVAAAGFWLIRVFGVVASIRLGAALTLVAGLGAVALSVAIGETSPTSDRPGKGEADGPGRPLPAVVVAVVFGSGLAALACEVVWIRYFSFVLGSSILSFSLVLGTLLAAFGLGSLLLPRLVRARNRHLDALGWILLTLGPVSAATVFLFLRFQALRSLIDGIAGSDDALATVGGRSLLTAAVLLLPGLLMGAVLAAATGAVADHRRTGRGVGTLYAATTAGNITGSLAAGYLLIPAIGASHSLVLLGAFYTLLGAVVLAWRRFTPRATAVAAVVASAGVVGWLALAAAPGATRAVAALPNPHATVTALHEGLRGTVTIYDVARLPLFTANEVLPGPPSMAHGYRLIAVNGVDVAGTSPDLQTTQKMQAHIPLLLHGHAARVLQVGYGSGKTTQEALLHRPETMHLVEINPDVVHEANRWFPNFAAAGHDAFFTDAKNFVRTTTERYDVILNDSTYPGIAGSSQLYSEDHFRACRARLEDGGVLSTWIPVDLPPETLGLVLAGFSSVFPDCSLWLPTNCWNKHGVLVGSLTSQDELLARLRHGDWPPEVRASLARLGYDNPEVFASMRVLNSGDIRELSAGVVPSTDDHPRLEYPARGVRVAGEDLWAETLRMILGRLGPPTRTATEEAGGRSPLRDCVRLLLSGQLALLGGDPDQALRFYGAASARCPGHPGPEGLSQEILTFQAQAAFAHALDAVQRGDHAAAFEGLRTTVQLCPSSAAARFELGQLLFASGRAAESIPHLEQSVALGGANLPRARLFLGDACLLVGRFADAESSYRSYLAEHPPLFEVVVALADAVATQGRPEEAIPLLEQALAMSPGHEGAIAMLEEARRELAAGSDQPE